MKPKLPKRTKAKFNEDLPRCVPRNCHSLLTGVFYAELLPGNRVRLVYTNGYKLSAVVSKDVLKCGKFLDVVDAVETAYAKRKLDKKLNKMTDQLQILEMQKGWHYMMGSQLNQEYETWQEHYENITGHPYRYSGN